MYYEHYGPEYIKSCRVNLRAELLGLALSLFVIPESWALGDGQRQGHRQWTLTGWRAVQGS